MSHPSGPRSAAIVAEADGRRGSSGCRTGTSRRPVAPLVPTTAEVSAKSSGCPGGGDRGSHGVASAENGPVSPREYGPASGRRSRTSKSEKTERWREGSWGRIVERCVAPGNPHRRGYEYATPGGDRCSEPWLETVRRGFPGTDGGNGGGGEDDDGRRAATADLRARPPRLRWRAC